MFNASWSELLIIAVVALVVIGPKDLPRAMRAVGRWTGRAKRMSSDFQRQLNEVVREAELEDVKHQLGELRKLDPTSEIKTSLGKLDINQYRTSSNARPSGDVEPVSAPEGVVQSQTAPADATPAQALRRDGGGRLVP